MNRITKALIGGVALAGLVGVTTASADPAPSSQSNYTAVSPTRILDTRNGTGAPKAAIPANGSLTIDVTPDGVTGLTAVTLNVTVAAPTGGGYITVDPGPTKAPTSTSNLNFSAGQVIANDVTTQVSADGDVTFWNRSTGTVQLVADLEGYYTASAPAYVAPQTVTQTLAGVPSVPTGGSFNSRATEVGTVDLSAGSYLVTLSAKATPLVQTDTSVQVFPSVHLYTEEKNADFTGDVLDTGGNALESGTITNADQFGSNSGVVTLTADTTLYLYAFGYDSDSGEGTYQLDSVTVTATPISVATS
jgi:hypothetical protein